jgi:multisubunit Na+/H+ antiporter MnhB subunit
VDPLLRSLATNREVPGWEETAMNWLIAAVVIAIAVALVMIFMKLLKKKAASGPVELTWSRGRSVLFVMAGLIPLAILIVGVWYFSINFHSIAGIPGLLKGILIAWILYTACMVVAHAGLWRNDLF